MPLLGISRCIGALGKPYFQRITQNQISPSIMPMALAVLERSNTDTDTHNGSESMHSLRDDSQNDPLTSPCKNVVEISKKPLRLNKIVGFLISDFTMSHLAVVEGFLSPQTPNSLPHERRYQKVQSTIYHLLSRTEYTRLARAFYHLERCSKIFKTSNRNGDFGPALQQSIDFL